jgi:DNA-binding IclR family transcriptional regulator
LTAWDERLIGREFEIANLKMARSSPGVRRVAAILNFLADHPGQAFTLTDLVRALKLSRATCHALLTSLVEVGYLYRASDKAYVLGPALVAIGRTAAQHTSPLQIAQPEMRALADEFDAMCSAYFRDRNEVVVRERAASATHLGWSIPLGARLKLRPPHGALFFAWEPRAEAEAWLDSCEPPLSREHRATLLASMAFAREHGFSFFVRNPEFPASEAQRTAEQVYSGAVVDTPVWDASEIDPDRGYPLAAVTAAVFDAQGKIAFVLSLTGFTRVTPGAEIERMGRRLCEACDRISGFLGGRRPAPASVAG